MSRLHKMVVVFDGEAGAETVKRSYKMVSEPGQAPVEVDIDAAERLALFGRADDRNSGTIAAALAQKDTAIAERDAALRAQAV